MWKKQNSAVLRWVVEGVCMFYSGSLTVKAQVPFQPLAHSALEKTIGLTKGNLQLLLGCVAAMCIIVVIGLVAEHVRQLCDKCGRRWAARPTGRYDREKNADEWECKYCNHKEWRKRWSSLTG